MKDTKILRAIGGINNDLIERAGQKPIKKRTPFPAWVKWAIPAAACLAIAVMIAIPLINRGGDFDLMLSSGVSVRHINNPPAIHMSGELIPFSEEAMFAERLLGFELVAFEGTVIRVENIVIDFGGRHRDYQAIATIEVSDVFRGDIEAGSNVTVLLPAPVIVTGDEVRTMYSGISSQMIVGTRGIFMPIRYNETAINEQNGNTLVLTDLAEFGFGDGERWIFLETSESLAFARWAYQSIEYATTLDEVRDYVITMIRQNVRQNALE